MIYSFATKRLPRRTRAVVDWIVTILCAVAVVLAVKAWVVNPYRIPTASMEPTLHCARPGDGCEAGMSDRVLANRLAYHFRDPRRGEKVVFDVPARARGLCGASGTFVKRIVGLPGETIELRLLRGQEFVFVDGKRIDEPYVEPERRGFGPERTWRIPPGSYFVMGDNRPSSCDSRRWGALPRENLIGPIAMTYWPPHRISFG
jgi:signal peptidase I